MTRLVRRLRRFAQAYPTVASLAGPQPAGACEAAPGEVHAGAATFVVSVPVSSGAVRAEPASAWGCAPATARSGSFATDAAPGSVAAPVHAPGARAAGPVVAPSTTGPALFLAGGAWTCSAAGPVSGEPLCPAPTAHGAGRSRVPPSVGGGHPATTASGAVRLTPGAHFAERPSRGLRAAATAGRVWRFIGRRAVEVRVFLMVTAAGLALLSLISLTAPDVEAPYEMHVDNGYQTDP